MTMSNNDDEELAQINVKVPERTKELAKEELEHGGLTRVVQETLSQIAHGGKTTERQRTLDHLEELRDEKREKVEERNTLDSEINDLELKIERAENRLDELDDKMGEYEGMLQLIESQMHEEQMHVDPGHGKIRDAAKKAGCDESDVIDDLRERNPDLPEGQFQAKDRGGSIGLE